MPRFKFYIFADEVTEGPVFWRWQVLRDGKAIANGKMESLAMARRVVEAVLVAAGSSASIQGGIFR